MERWTKRDSWGDTYIDTLAKNLEFMIEKLAYYEDLEESGKLLELPYLVGTLLFIPCRKQGVKQDHIRRWQTNNKGLMFCSNGSFYLADAIGKSVFLTREEAELKLMEGEK